ncbi:prepilin peptidase [Kitasatospora kifunensis]|uniref:Leader peptidase (Prepilin peptidase)/N-methyltransferase n=1 Tax=Kitasatospora kifunensis TaxID=58351 RepID=A0A7W7RBW6_KITKI|nr:prepilin peptidase [Kitasatospora kifunensis]MBB4929136.1 leader peptidase (prepilin peptidase)/N-methyltransferase [Kitasatospora kifunensis]
MTTPILERLRPDSDTRTTLRRWAVPTAAAAALLGAAVTYRFGRTPVLPTLLAFTVMGCILATLDTALHRLPDSVTLPGTLVVAVLLTYPAAEHPGAALRAAACAGAMIALYWTTYLLGTAGRGDVKASAAVGLATGWFGWTTAVAAFVLAWLLLGFTASALLAARRAGLSSRVSMGAAMYGGAVLAILMAGPPS